MVSDINSMQDCLSEYFRAATLTLAINFVGVVLAIVIAIANGVIGDAHAIGASELSSTAP